MMSPTYRLPPESTLMAWTQLTSPARSSPSMPLGTVNNCNSRTGAKLAPLIDEFAGPVKVDHASIAVAVADEDVAVGGNGHIGRHVEMRLVASSGPLGAQSHEQLAFRRVLLDGVMLDVGDPDV